MIPYIEYGASIPVDFTLDAAFPKPSSGVGYGDEDMSGAGIPISYVVRYDEWAELKLRFTDDEYDAVMAFLAYQMVNRAEPFYLQFNVDDIATRFSVYLDTPKANSRARPTRHQQDASVWEFSITVRSVNSTNLHVSEVVD